MDLIHTVRAMQALADERRAAGQTLALVPTMGALHEGHLALVEAARQHADHITVSIFVNPTQFGPNEDFDRYPRQLEADRKALESGGGVDVIFAPVLEEMYPDGKAAQLTWVDVEQMDAHLCGRHRPGHFRGVTTVVSKLFHCCRPHVAVFGRKDAQQFIILQRMVRDLNFGIELIGVPIVREANGLALSSRNVFLTPDERRQSVVLSQAVEAAREHILGGEQQAKALVETMRQTIAQAPDARIQYTEVVDATTLNPLDTLEPGCEALAAVAVYFGATRLIDNVFVRVPQPD